MISCCLVALEHQTQPRALRKAVKDGKCEGTGRVTAREAVCVDNADEGCVRLCRRSVRYLKVLSQYRKGIVCSF